MITPKRITMSAIEALLFDVLIAATQRQLRWTQGRCSCASCRPFVRFVEWARENANT
jgi:hypothetical protein